MKNILVTGGAGYVGSHTVLDLVEGGFNPIIYDNLTTGNRAAVLKGKLFIADLADEKSLDKLFKTEKISAVVHLAALINPSESLKKPDLYIQNNYHNSLNLIKTMLRYDVMNLVFSSSAAVYGDQKEMPVMEEALVKPKNPYAKSKAMFEEALRNIKNKKFRFVVLRYFNAAGADLKGRLCFETSSEPSLIKAAITSVINQRELLLYGTDYHTADGTCIRDYVHVTDLARAHVLALNYLFNGGQSTVINLGGGTGYSNYETIGAVKKISMRNFDVKAVARRPGDIVVSVASIKKAKNVLNWEPSLGLQSIIETSLQCQQKLKSG